MNLGIERSKSLKKMKAVKDILTFFFKIQNYLICICKYNQFLLFQKVKTRNFILLLKVIFLLFDINLN